MTKCTCVAVLLAAGLALGRGTAEAQGLTSVGQLSAIPAVTGHEQGLTKAIREELKGLSPKTDNMGNVWVTFGEGAPHRLIATAIDEPGYVVSDIAEGGFLRVQRLPQAAPNAVFDSLSFAQPVWVVTRGGKKVNGVFAGLSVHLEPGRLNLPKMNHPDELYVDIGARSAAEVHAAGVDLLDPVALQRSDFSAGKSAWAGPATGDRFGCAALLALARRMKESKGGGTTTIAFVTQQWTGGRGLNRLLTKMRPDEMIFVGRIAEEKPSDAKGSSAEPGSGVVIGAGEKDAAEGSLAAALKELGEKERLPVQVVTAKPVRMIGYAPGAAFPERFAQMGVPTLYPVTPAESVSWSDKGNLERLLQAYLGIAKSAVGIVGDGLGGITDLPPVRVLTEAYGASGHEEGVRKVVLSQLPPWAQKSATTDAAGNLVLHIGAEKKDPKTPSIVFMAHMDEIGYEVKKIEDDGRLLVSVLGGGYPQYFLGHVALVHKSDGSTVGGVMDLPAGWDQPVVPGKPLFEWPLSLRPTEPIRVYVGTKSKEETEKLGIKEGDWVTIPKKYRELLGTRANARSFDDRVGDAALIAAVNAIAPAGPELPGRDVTFVWSTREEVGLEGAAAYAEQAAKEGHVPDFVFAIDTFVSSDSPLEVKRFGDAEIGRGFVVRAVDNSNIVPLEYVDRVVKLARENKIPVQYGVTGGGNDGAVFTRFGSVDVALGWPLRYSHSPGEVIDTRDLDGLGKIVAVIAKSW